MTIPLNFAVLCVDCDTVCESGKNRCERCGSRALLSLARVLDRDVQASRLPEQLSA